MRNRKSLPIAALRAFEAAARHGRLTAASEELAVTHGAISRHVSHLEAFIGAPLFEGPRNRPQLTPEGRLFGFALTNAFDQIEDALTMIGTGGDKILDVACLSTFAARWLIPRLHTFSAKYPRYDVRLATDDPPPKNRIDVQILVLAPANTIAQTDSLLFEEYLGWVAAPSKAQHSNKGEPFYGVDLPRLGTRTRPQAWQEWAQLSGIFQTQEAVTVGVFDHYNLTIEAALNGLGAAIAPWHLVSEDISSGRLIAPYGFHRSGLHYVARVTRPGNRKAEHFVSWLLNAAAEFPRYGPSKEEP